MYVIGAGGHAKVIIDIIQESNEIIQGVLDEKNCDKEIMGIPIIGDYKSFVIHEGAFGIIAIGNNRERKEISRFLKSVKFVKIIHYTSFISKTTIIGEGTVIMSNVSVNASSIIGSHVILNTNSSIDHDCIIENFVHISPNVALAGNVKIGEGTHIGIGSAIIQGVKVGKWATIGAGTVIIRDVPDYAVVVGNPGKVIKFNVNEE